MMSGITRKQCCLYMVDDKPGNLNEGIEDRSILAFAHQFHHHLKRFKPCSTVKPSEKPLTIPDNLCMVYLPTSTQMYIDKYTIHRLFGYGIRPKRIFFSVSLVMVCLVVCPKNYLRRLAFGDGLMPFRLLVVLIVVTSDHYCHLAQKTGSLVSRYIDDRKTSLVHGKQLSESN